MSVGCHGGTWNGPRRRAVCELVATYIHTGIATVIKLDPVRRVHVLVLKDTGVLGHEFANNQAARQRLLGSRGKDETVEECVLTAVFGCCSQRKPIACGWNESRDLQVGEDSRAIVAHVEAVVIPVNVDVPESIVVAEAGAFPFDVPNLGLRVRPCLDCRDGERRTARARRTDIGYRRRCVAPVGEAVYAPSVGDCSHRDGVPPGNAPHVRLKRAGCRTLRQNALRRRRATVHRIRKLERDARKHFAAGQA